MAKFNVGALIKEELEYELNIRGMLASADTVDSMKSKLRSALKAEASEESTYTNIKYPYAYKEDMEALTKKLEEITRLVEAYRASSKETEFVKAKSKADYALRRAGRVVYDNDAQHQAVLDIRSQIIVLTGKLFTVESESELEDDDLGFSKITLTASTPKKARVVENNSGTISEVGKWNLKFKGDHNGSVNAFLERAEELRLAKGLSKTQLFKAAVELFDDKALIWFRANRKRIGGWDKLIEELRAEFLPADYDDRLWEEIRHRTQGDDETMGVYVAIMEQMFSRLNDQCDEAKKLKILKRNISPFYQQQLAHSVVETTNDLVRLGKVVETTRASIEAFKPPSKAKQTLEPDLAYRGTSMTRRCDAIQVETRLKCRNCGHEGHDFRDCRMILKCFGCGRPGVKRYNCPQCSGDRGNRRQRMYGNHNYYRNSWGSSGEGNFKQERVKNRNNQQSEGEWRREIRGRETNDGAEVQARENGPNETGRDPGNGASAR